MYSDLQELVRHKQNKDIFDSIFIFIPLLKQAIILCEHKNNATSINYPNKISKTQAASCAMWK